MSDTPKTYSDAERAAFLSGWLKSVKPANPPKPSAVERIGEWRHELVAAVRQGYTWRQLAREVAAKPEIGLTVSGTYLKKCVHDAFVAAKETPPPELRGKRHRKAKKLAAKPVSSVGKAAGA